MEKIKLQDIQFYRNKMFITIPANASRSVIKERKRVDLSSLKRERVLPGLIHYSGVVEAVVNREISFWKLKKQKKLKNGDVMSISTHLSSKEEALRVYAEFKIKSRNL
jgi:hypothetical protein